MFIVKWSVSFISGFIISANIAKNAWGNNAYYTILLKDDQYINKAKEILKK